MIRRIININKEKCNGCGICAKACHEGAIEMINGKAQLSRDDYCDGLGDCLPTCPTGAIMFIEKDTVAYDEKAVKENMRHKSEKSSDVCISAPHSDNKQHCQPAQWPVQIKLLPITAPYFNNSDLLIGADCTAYAYADFHNKFIKNKITLIGCPKLDNVDYSEKLSAIFANNSINSVTLVRMEVPCCKGLELAVKKALTNSGRDIPLNITVISTNGHIL